VGPSKDMSFLGPSKNMRFQEGKGPSKDMRFQEGKQKMGPSKHMR
jgi:hypothetical protein